MKITWPKAGSYVVAVSGGVDSVVLLDLLAERLDVALSVAHFDHGIRPDSATDAVFVEQLAARYNMRFFMERGKLGPKASEALARQKRYEFLNDVKCRVKAEGIITAHHQDDVLETATLNILRGGGRKALTSLSSGPNALRPLLATGKQDIIAYAKAKQLDWREDATNQDTRYLRNYIRHELLSKFPDQQKMALTNLVTAQKSLNSKIDTLLVKYYGDDELNRQNFSLLSHALATEVLAAWLRRHNVKDFDRKTINRLVVGAKTARPGSRLEVLDNRQLIVNKQSLTLA